MIRELSCRRLKCSRGRAGDAVWAECCCLLSSMLPVLSSSACGHTTCSITAFVSAPPPVYSAASAMLPSHQQPALTSPLSAEYVARLSEDTARVTGSSSGSPVSDRRLPLQPHLPGQVGRAPSSSHRQRAPPPRSSVGVVAAAKAATLRLSAHAADSINRRNSQ
jgi:hypothetical protein